MEINSYTLLKEFEVVASGLLFILPVIPLLMLKTLPPFAILVATSSLHSPALEWSKDTTRHPWCRIGSDALSLCQGFTLPIWLLQLGGALAERSSEI